MWLVAGMSALPAASAQAVAPVDLCEVALAEARERYVEQQFAAVESLVDTCVAWPEASTLQVQQAYRLLALAFIRQDMIREAQTTVLKLLGVAYDYRPDVIQDPPVYVALVASVQEQLRVASSPATAPGEPARIDLNTATAGELEGIPGIGPALAGRILAYRDREGPFRSLEDLDDVSGIGPQTLQRLAPYLSVGGGWATRSGGGVTSAPAAAQPVEPALAPAAPAPASESRGSAALIDLNTAGAEALESLDGIGPALAARIIAYRESEGPFRTVADVLAVRGIGPRTLERFEASVTVGAGDGE